MTATVFQANAGAAGQLRAQLQADLLPTQLEVIDESGDHAGHAGSNVSASDADTAYGTHFRVRVASPHFDGQNRVACHRLVYDSLQPFIAQGVHAIAIEIVR